MKHRLNLLSAALLAGCTGSLEPPGKQLAIIGAGPPSNVFPGIPDTVGPGPTTIRYHSYGSSTCNRPAGEAVETQATAVVITAYDEYVPPNTPCTADFATYNRSVVVPLTRGMVAIRLRGLELSGNSTPKEITKTIVVR